MEGNAKQNWEDKYLLNKSFDRGALEESMSALGVNLEGSSWFIKDEFWRERFNTDEELANGGF